MASTDDKKKLTEREKLDRWVEGEFTLAATPKPQHVAIFHASPNGTIDLKTPVNQRVLSKDDDPRDVSEWIWGQIYPEVEALRGTQLYAVRFSREGTAPVRLILRVKFEAEETETVMTAVDDAPPTPSGGPDILLRVALEMLRTREDFLREMTTMLHASMNGVQTQWQTLNAGLMDTNKHLATALTRERDRQVEVRERVADKSATTLELEIEREKSRQAADERAQIFRGLGAIGEAVVGRVLPGGPVAPGATPAAPGGGVVVSPRAAHALKQMGSLFRSMTPEQRRAAMEPLQPTQLLTFSEIAEAVSESADTPDTSPSPSNGAST